MKDVIIIYQVIAGSFTSKENAEKRVDYLISRGIEAFVKFVSTSQGDYFRVQAGAFSEKEMALRRVQAIVNVGIKDAYTTVEEEISAPVSSSGLTIIGRTFLSPEQMHQFVLKLNPKAMRLSNYYVNFGINYGIRGDVAFAQALHETNFFRFTGIVRREQNNFAGIGATGPNSTGAWFATRREGVLAHIQHLYAYASIYPLPDKYPLVDPRFYLVQRGSATTWESLGGKWAVPGNDYGDKVLNIYKRMVDSTIQELGDLSEEIV